MSNTNEGDHLPYTPPQPTLAVHFSAGDAKVVWTPEDEARLDAALVQRAMRKALLRSAKLLD